jgi:hypothetical protein
MEPRFILTTGQETCFNEAGEEIPCAGSGQDAEFRKGVVLPEPRFVDAGEEVLDRLTGHTWLRDAGTAGFPLSWLESLDFIASMNREQVAGRSDWRLPNRRELRSLVCHGAARPALPAGHPFDNVMQSWYWTATTAAINHSYAWYINLEGARMFYGAKDQYFMLWPVRGEGNGQLPATGQEGCYDENGLEIRCEGTGQDGEYGNGTALPRQRFEVGAEGVFDRLTRLVWHETAALTGGVVSWEEALAAVASLNDTAVAGRPWRLPNINELESLVDCGTASPALPTGHPFRNVRDAYWSSTTSAYETDWAWALYLDKGACGVGRKNGRYFFVWPVRDAHNREGG